MMVARKVTDYRGNQRYHAEPRTCEACKALYIDVASGRLVDKVCPPCRVATGTYRWTTCSICDHKFAESKQCRRTDDVCRQCLMAIWRKRERQRSCDRHRRERSRLNQMRPAPKPLPPSMSSIDPERFLAMCDLAELARTPMERDRWKAVLDKWRRPMTEAELTERKEKGLPVRPHGGG